MEKELSILILNLQNIFFVVSGKQRNLFFKIYIHRAEKVHHHYIKMCLTWVETKKVENKMI